MCLLVRDASIGIDDGEWVAVLVVDVRQSFAGAGGFADCVAAGIVLVGVDGAAPAKTTDISLDARSAQGLIRRSG